tara:strand:- start:221 stop:406 length:186 start_codon:yes stop_codon:yes gene_type:complete
MEVQKVKIIFNQEEETKKIMQTLPRTKTNSIALTQIKVPLPKAETWNTATQMTARPSKVSL